MQIKSNCCKYALRSLGVIITALGLSAPAQALYKITDLGTLGGADSYGMGINNSGQVTGYSKISNGDTHAFVAVNGVMTDLGTLGSEPSKGYGINNYGQVTGDSWTDRIDLVFRDFAFITNNNVMTALTASGSLGEYISEGHGINDKGQITGNAFVGLGSPHAFVTDIGSNALRDLGTLGGSESYGMGINSGGQVTGYSEITPIGGDLIGDRHAFIMINGVMTDLGTLVGYPLSGFWSEGRAINDSGQVTGYADRADTFSHAFVTDAITHKMTDLSTIPGYYSSVGNDINNNGQVTGTSSDLEDHAFVTVDGAMTDLNRLIPPNSGWVLNNGNGINDSGQIVGTGTINGVNHAFLLTEVSPLTVLTITPAAHIRISGSVGGVLCGAICKAAYNINTSIILTAKPEAGYVFTGWTGACTGTQTTCTVTMDSNKTVGATYGRSLKYTKAGTGTGTVISSPDGINCTSSCSAIFGDHAAVTLVAYPDLHSVFTGWTGAKCTGTGVCALTMDAAKAVTATFTLNYTLSVSKTGNGTVTGTLINCGSKCKASYGKATTLTLTATPSKGSKFVGWGGACSGAVKTCIVTMNASNTDQSVTATFSP